MSSAEAQVAYNQGSPLEPMEAQEDFAKQFDLSQPEQAMDMYQKLMHQHTKQQIEMASMSSRRATKASVDSNMATLSTETSQGSISSTSS